MDLVRGTQSLERVFTAIDADPGVSGNQAFSFLGTAAFSAVGQIRYAYDAGLNETIVQANTDANFSTAELEVHLLGNILLTQHASDL
jgi:serralysin